MVKPSLVAAYHIHDDDQFLAASITSLQGKVPTLAFVSRVPWSGQVGDWERAAKIARDSGAEVILGHWASEAEHRTASLEECQRRGVEKMLIPDGDEIFEVRLLEQFMKIASADIADRVYVQWDTYWKTADYVIRPREGFTPCFLIDPRRVKHSHLRDYVGGRGLFLSAEHGIVHHLSYVGSDERIRKKTTTWSHKDEVVPGWWGNAWKAWDDDKTLANLHPTHPQAYGFAERIIRPEELRHVLPPPPKTTPWLVPANWPKVSVVIPVHGGAELVDSCLSSLCKCSDLVFETIVVDNASEDESLAVCKKYPPVILMKNKENLGFAKACNQGFERSTGEVVLFLNSDTVVPRVGLIELVRPLIGKGTVAATGPLTNECGHLQKTAPTYTNIENLDLFAEDFAERIVEDREVDMLVGFCLALRRTALEDVGLFDERFGIGLFEDNDLCYRLRRAGWRLVIASKAYVHHEGSKTIQRLGGGSELLETNRQKYEEKWSEDRASGFASTLSGLSAERISFSEDRRPENLAKRLEKKSKKANVSLCMIVRDEERVLADCLRSASPFFAEKIIVDTGSSDKTVEIAESFGATVRKMVWPDSFALSRNESLKGAKGDWIFWMDADDTIPPHCGEAILDAAISAPTDVHGFVIPVQFVDGGPGAGVRVDHVKLFRNLSGVAFEGRIHEQMLGSLREHGGQIARCGAHVLHSGYDNSVEGQKKKRERDEKLLKLDLEDRPDHPFVLFNLGMTAHYTHDHEAAVDWLTQSIAKAKPFESHVRKAYSLLSGSLRELGRMEDAIAKLEEGLGVVGEDPELRFFLGQNNSTLGNLEVAAKNYELTLQTDVSNNFTSMDVGILGFKTLHNLAGVYFAQGRYQDGKAQLLMAIQEAPQFIPSAFMLFDQGLANGDFAAAKFALEHVESTEGPSKSWIDMTVKFAEKIGGPQNVDATLRSAYERHSNSVDVARAFGRHCLQYGDTNTGVGILETIAGRDAEAAYFLGIEASRRGDFQRALEWTERSLALNPGHEDTAKQVENLKRLLNEGGT